MLKNDSGAAMFFYLVMFFDHCRVMFPNKVNFKGNFYIRGCFLILTLSRDISFFGCVVQKK